MRFWLWLARFATVRIYGRSTCVTCGRKEHVTIETFTYHNGRRCTPCLKEYRHKEGWL